MQEFILSLLDRFGYMAVLLLITIENLFPPIPSEVILTLGGFMTTYTSMNVPGVILFSTAGSVLGAIILYYVGKILNQDRLLALSMGPVGRALHFRTADICRSISNFRERGSFSVFYCRFIPILRSLISIPAGMSQMEQGKFLIYTTVGSLLWNTLLISLGRLLGDNWEKISRGVEKYSAITKLALVLLAVGFVIKKLRKRQK